MFGSGAVPSKSAAKPFGCVFFFLFAVIIKSAPQLKTVYAALLLHLSGQDNTLRGGSSLSWMVLPLLNALIHSI